MLENSKTFSNILENSNNFVKIVIFWDILEIYGIFLNTYFYLEKFYNSDTFMNVLKISEICILGQIWINCGTFSEFLIHIFELSKKFYFDKFEISGTF